MKLKPYEQLIRFKVSWFIFAINLALTCHAAEIRNYKFFYLSLVGYFLLFMFNKYIDKQKFIAFKKFPKDKAPKYW